jgi:hypothetical protein
MVKADVSLTDIRVPHTEEESVNTYALFAIYVCFNSISVHNRA